MGLPEPNIKSLPATTNKLQELGQIIKGTAKPLSEYELDRHYRLKTKGASSLVNPVIRAEREVKLEMLGKMVRGV
jgi:hypothetical protein